MDDYTDLEQPQHHHDHHYLSENDHTELEQPHIYDDNDYTFIKPNSTEDYHEHYFNDYKYPNDTNIESFTPETHDY